MNYYKSLLLGVSLTLLAVSGCKKEETDDIAVSGLTNPEIQSHILNDFCQKVAIPAYAEMENRMNVLYNACIAFDASQTQQHLDDARNAWREVRATWEQTEAFLFGPVSTNNIDPSTDTWPIDFNALDSLLQTSNAFTQSYINSLGDELKGYHPAEFLLWGQNGNKLPGDFTLREREYLIALAADLQIKATSLRSSWDLSVSGNYAVQFATAGDVTSIYPSQRAALEELINGMIGICDEVANGKIGEPFTLADPSLEESPFSGNSIADFTNNIRGVKNVYFGKFVADGYGIHDFMAKNNLALHNEIATAIDNAINSFGGITVPFGQAITTQPTQVQHVINQVNALKDVLETELLPYIQQTVTN
jgi:predicted lipoprotein